MKTDNICDRCMKPMDTANAEMNAIQYGRILYACEHCGKLYRIYRPEIVVYKPLGDWEDITEDDWGKKVIPDKDYKEEISIICSTTL